MLNAASLKEVFEINEDKIRAGLAEEDVGNASMLQLFYLVFFYQLKKTI